MSVGANMRSINASVHVGLCLTLLCVGLVGCGKNDTMSEADLMARLEASDLTIERLTEATITSKQRDRLGAEPTAMFSIRVSDATGSSQTMTLVQFDKDWQAAAVADEGVHGFVIHNWYVVGVVSAQIRSQIEAALL